MLRLIVLACLISVGCLQAQEVKPLFEKEGKLVKATYFHDNGNIKEQGFFKDAKLEGTWTSYNEDGLKIAIAQYDSGKKVGKWFMWHKDQLREVNFNNSVVESVKLWKQSTEIAKR